MAYREITDRDGRTWQVWDTDPHQFAGRQVIAPDYASGWLTFECGNEKRRVAPSPARWEALDDPALLRLLLDAEVIQPHAALSASGDGTPRTARPRSGPRAGDGPSRVEQTG